MKEINIEKTILSFIEVPEWVIPENLCNTGNESFFRDLQDGTWYYSERFEGGKYRLLGEVTKEDIDFDCTAFVEKTEKVLSEGILVVLSIVGRSVITNYKDYMDNEMFPFKDSKHSFRTLMESHGINLTEGNKFIVLEAKCHES